MLIVGVPDPESYYAMLILGWRTWESYYAMLVGFPKVSERLLTLC